MTRTSSGFFRRFFPLVPSLINLLILLADFLVDNMRKITYVIFHQ